MANITIYRGITHNPLLLIFEDSNGVQIDLAGWGVEAQARKKPKKTPILDLEPVILPVGTLLGYEGEVDGPGRVKLADFSDDQTSAFKDAKLLWDCILLPPDGRRLGPFGAGSCIITTIITEDDDAC